MSFQDLEQGEIIGNQIEGFNNQAVIISQDILNDSFSQEQNYEQNEQINNQEICPQFSQTQNSHILSELANTPSQPKLLTRNTIIPQATGIFSYIIDNQVKLYDVFQNYLHRIFQFYFYSNSLEQNIIQNYIELQNVRRKLKHITTIYQQTFGALKNCIQLYQEKVMLLTSEIDKEDPYSLLTQSEIDLRRSIHDFYSSIESDDPFTQSKGMMTGSGNLSQYKNIQFDSFNPAELTSLDRIASFILNSLELEKVNISVDQLLRDYVARNLLRVTQDLLKIWVFLFDFLNQYDVPIVQFNFEIEASSFNAGIVGVSTIQLVPLDICQKIQKKNNEELSYYSLRTKGQSPLKLEYESMRDKKSQERLQTFLHFDKLENLLRIADDALTNEKENFSFSNAEHSVNDEMSDYQQTLQNQKRYQYNSEQYKETILDQAMELTFKGKITEAHLTDIFPPKHRAYVSECGQMWKKVVPLVITRINCDKPKIELDNINYFHHHLSYLHIFQPNTKILQLWQLETSDIKKYICEVRQNFSDELISFACQEGHLFVFNPFSKQADNQFYKFNLDTMRLQLLPPMKIKRRKFKVVQQRHYLYLIGGENEEPLSNVERFNMRSMEWEEMKPMQQGLINPNILLYCDRYIIRFGGINKFGHIDRNIERFDGKRHKWCSLRQIEKDNDTELPQGCVCIQVNEKDILIFGGYNHYEFRSNSILILNIYGDKNDPQCKVSKITAQQQFLNLIGEFDTNVYFQNDRIYLFRKEYSSLY